MKQSKYNAVDLFSGCGGLSEGLHQAGFDVVAGVEFDKHAARTYRLNHPKTELFEIDVRKLDSSQILEVLNGESLHLLAGCPPCQGFSSLRKRNKKTAAPDKRNRLISEYLRFVRELDPCTIMLENVPGIVDYSLFKSIVKKLKMLGYHVEYKIIDVANYSVPQRRKRLVLVGSKLGKIDVAKGENKTVTVRDVFRKLDNSCKNDLMHTIYPNHTDRIKKLISLIPKDGGSRRDLPKRYQLNCHKKKNVGFNDVYGRLAWDAVSSTITGGCLSPSKGRFLHPSEDRCISAREAASLQTFPSDYKFIADMPKAKLALLIGNALPPEFTRIQALNIRKHIKTSKF